MAKKKQNPQSEPAHDSELVSFRNITEWSKDDLTRLGVALVNSKEENGEDIEKLLAFAAKIKHYADAIITAGKPIAFKEVVKYKGGHMVSGVVLTATETGVKYDYGDDPVVNFYENSIAEIEEPLKAHKELLKKLPIGGMGLTNPETGETYHAHPPLKTGTPNVNVTIK